jgi:hypothetical protein
MGHVVLIRAYIVIAIAAALMLSALRPADADIYKYVDSNGVIHFSNIPAADESQKIIKEDHSAGRYSDDSGPRMTGSAEACRGVINYTPGNKAPIGDDVPFADIINRKSKKYGVDPQLVKAVIKAESNFKPRAVSAKGAQGLMQLMPATAKMMGVRNSFDPEQNIDGGVKYLKYLLENFKGDIELTVAAYNCGEGRVARNGNTVPNIRETKNYVKKVMKLSKNPLTGETFSRPIYKVMMDDGSIMFTDTPVTGGQKMVN